MLVLQLDGRVWEDGSPSFMKMAFLLAGDVHSLIENR